MPSMRVLVLGATGGTGRYRVGERLALRGLPKVSRADVADFILAQIEDSTSSPSSLESGMRWWRP